MSNLAELRSNLNAALSKVTTQSHALLVKTAHDNRLAADLHNWAKAVNPEAIRSLLKLVDSLESQATAAKITTTGSLTISGSNTVNDAPINPEDGINVQVAEGVSSGLVAIAPPEFAEPQAEPQAAEPVEPAAAEVSAPAKTPRGKKETA